MSNYSHSLPRRVHYRASGAEEHGDFSAAGQPSMDEPLADGAAVGGPALIASNAASGADNNAAGGVDNNAAGNENTGSDNPARKPADTRSRTLNTNMAQTWLAWQCKMIAGIIHGSLYFPNEDRLGLNPVSRWPKEASSELSLSSISRQVLKSKKPLVLPRYKYGPGNQRICDLVACPLLSDGEVIAVVACGISTRSEAQQQAIMQLLQWGSLWLDTLLQQQSVAAKEHGAFVHRLLVLSMSQRSSHAACIETTNQLATHFGCDRVSIGFSDSLQIRLRAISGLAYYDPRTEMA
ncbi:MAG: GAF domain-containing protein, partial [Gammaproteobacteria bacterium]|nr:GAF domain-containing protein [Gammaproteobacteria bacterium]